MKRLVLMVTDDDIQKGSSSRRVTMPIREEEADQLFSEAVEVVTDTHWDPIWDQGLTL